MRISNSGEVCSELIGRVLSADTFEVSRDHTVGYALAVNDENDKYVDDGSTDVIAPPMFGICFANRLIRRAIIEKVLPLPLERTVHGEHELLFSTPIKPGDVLVSEGVVINVEKRSTGSTVEIEMTSKARDGVLRIRQIQTLFVRSLTKTRNKHRIAASRLNPDCVSTVKVSQDQVFRYAKASFTEGAPQHEDHDYARSLGYDTCFLTGQNTLAFAAKALVDNVAKGDPTRLERLKVRFSQVVYPFDLLTTNIWRDSSSNHCSFETTKQDGSLVLTNGEADILF